MAGFNLKDVGITPAAIIADVQQRLMIQPKLKSKGDILKSLIDQCAPVDFTANCTRIYQRKNAPKSR
jgi:hypothetical protein